MAKENTPNYYAIIPASVRYDDLAPNAKLLYGEIAALCNQEGFCWANNRYFANLYKITPKHVSDLITALVEHGHIAVNVDKTSGNARSIYLTEAIRKNQDTYPENSGEGIRKIPEHNNTVNNKNNNTSPKTTDSTPDQDIQSIYELYLKLFKVTDTIKDIEQAKKRYKLTPGRRDAIKRRLNDAGFNMLRAAIVGYSRDRGFDGQLFYKGENDRGWVADLEKFICRSYEKVEEGANKYEAQKQAKPSNDPWA